jgi:Transcription factor zinc-finger
MTPNCPVCQATPNVIMLTSEMNYGLCFKCGGLFVFNEDLIATIITREQWNGLLPECRIMLRMMSRIEGLIPHTHQLELV